MVALKAVVIALGVLIVGTIGVVVVVLVNRAGDGADDRGAEAGAPAPFRATLDLGAGCEVAEIRTGQGRLLVRTDGPGECRRIHLIDSATGEIVGTVALSPTP